MDRSQAALKVNTTVGSPLFGRITSTVKGSRQVQLALKYVF